MKLILIRFNRKKIGIYFTYFIFKFFLFFPYDHFKLTPHHRSPRSTSCRRFPELYTHSRLHKFTNIHNDPYNKDFTTRIQSIFLIIYNTFYTELYSKISVFNIIIIVVVISYYWLFISIMLGSLAIFKPREHEYSSIRSNAVMHLLLLYY